MKIIGIKKQPWLGFARTFSITINGIRYRLFRSFITLVVVTVAIAFMMNVLSESVLKQSILRLTRDKIREKRMVSEYVAHFSVPAGPEEILQKIALADENDPIYREVRIWSGFSDSQIQQFRREAGQAKLYLDFFAHLKYVYRLRLTPNSSGCEIFDRLGDRGSFDRFVETLKTVRSIRFVTSTSDFRQFLDQWPEIKRKTSQLQNGHAQAIGRLAAELESVPVLDAMANAQQFLPSARNAGFSLEESFGLNLAQQAELVLVKSSIEETITNPDMQKVLAASLDLLPTEISRKSLWKLLSQNKPAVDYLQELNKHKLARQGLTAEMVVELAKKHQEDANLSKAERLQSDSNETFLGIDERMGWLVLISIIVCIVGIANVMLMSVTERFREIATLKCLGALDGFIMLSFIIEALLLGAVGGILGSVLGVFIALGRMFLAFGSLLIQSLSFQTLLGWMLLSTLMGIILAVVASVYPSFRAARLAPMEAMRVE